MRAVPRRSRPKRAQRLRRRVAAEAGPWIGSGWAGSPRSRSGRLALEEPHLHAGELNDVVVVEPTRLRTDGDAIHLREVVVLAAVDVHDEVALGAPRDRRDLHAGAAERGERLGQFKLAAGKRAGEYLELGFRERDGRVGYARTRRGPLRCDGLGRLVDGGADAPNAVFPLRARGDDHGLFELVLLRIAVLAVDEPQLVMADGDDIAMLHGVLLDQLPIHVRAVGAVQVFEERVVQNIDDERVMTAHRRVIDADVIIRKAPNRVALLVHVVFREDLTVQA